MMGGRSWRLKSVAISALIAGGMFIATGATGRNESSKSSQTLSLANGVVVSAKCNEGAASAQHIAFSNRSSHTFLGYGVNVQTGKAVQNIPRTVEDIKKLGFVWVRANLGQGGGSTEPLTEEGGDSLGPDAARDASAALLPSHKQFYAALQAAGVRVVSFMSHPPASFFGSGPAAKNGKPGRRIKPETIPSLAQYYATYIRSLAQNGVHFDLLELTNEPNLPQNGKYGPGEYAELLKDVETDLSGFAGNLAGPGTAARIPQAAGFVGAMRAQGAVAGLKAVSVHTYYIRDKADGPDVPPADDPEFQVLVAAARAAGLPLISTEFGGTDIKTKLTDPSRESVDPAEELKAALDLIRAGESAAIVWNLYPNNGFGKLLYTWALIDAKGPTNAYWPFYILSRRIPVGADVLAVDHTDVSPAFTSLGYAAFRTGRRVYVGLSNPAPTSAATVALDLSRLGPYSVVHGAGFLSDRATDQDAGIRSGSCPLTVTIPGGTGAVLDLALLQ